MVKKRKRKIKWNYKVCIRNLFHALVCGIAIILTSIIIVIIMNFLYNL